MIYTRRTNTENPDNGIGYMMFAEDDVRIEHYGKYIHTFDSEAVPSIYAGSDELADAVRASFFDSDIADEYDTDDLMDELNPDDIIDSATVWDAPDIVTHIYEHVLEPNGWFTVITYDGAITFDESIITTTRETNDG